VSKVFEFWRYQSSGADDAYPRAGVVLRPLNRQPHSIPGGRSAIPLTLAVPMSPGNRYFKMATNAHPALGPGMVWFEFAGAVPQRQVERYGDQWFDSRTEYHPELGPGLGDQPPEVVGLGPDDEISQAEFEEAWSESLRHGA
jgi:hypothetical protein